MLYLGSHPACTCHVTQAVSYLLSAGSARTPDRCLLSFCHMPGHCWGFSSHCVRCSLTGGVLWLTGSRAGDVSVGRIAKE